MLRAFARLGPRVVAVSGNDASRLMQALVAADES